VGRPLRAGRVLLGCRPLRGCRGRVTGPVTDLRRCPSRGVPGRVCRVQVCLVRVGRGLWVRACRSEV